MKKTFTVIANILLIAFMIIGFLVLFSLFPIKNNFKFLSVMSGSMEPMLKTGELIVVKPSILYEVGDIVTFDSQGANGKGSTTTHRIIGTKTDNGAKLFQTKGDANSTADGGWTKSSDIIGKYRFGIKYLGYLIGYIKTLPGLIIIIVIPATIIIYEEIRKIRTEAKNIIKKRRAKKAKKREEKHKTKNYKNN